MCTSCHKADSFSIIQYLFMKKIYSLFLALVALVATAQTAATVTFPKVQHWTGKGSKQAALVIAWNNGLNQDTLVWGYRFDAPTTSAQMLEAVVKSDPRLYAAVSSSSYGLYVEGLGYDRNNHGEIAMANLDFSAFAHVPDGWWMRAKGGMATSMDGTDHFFGGYNVQNQKYFVHLVSDKGEAFKASQGASSRQLSEGSIDVWSYQTWDAPFALTTYTPVPAAPFYKRGVFMVNEDQFGKQSGTVNFFDTESKTWSYRAYRQANTGRTLGATAQYGTIYGGRFYFISKQNFQTTGGRLVIANAANLAQVVDEKELPGGRDGRAIAFPRNDDDVAFITTNKGIVLYDVEEMKFDGTIEEVNEECGRIVPAGYYLFVETRKNEILVLDPEERQVVQRIENATWPTLASDGRLWVLRDKKLVAYDTEVLEMVQEVELGESAPTPNKWAWNAGTLFAGKKTNSLYWASGKAAQGAQQVYRLNLEEESPKAQLIYDLTGKTTPYLYGAAIGLRPEDEHIFLQAFKDWSDKTYVLYEIDEMGKEVGQYPLEEQHHWFPAMPVFPDMQAPTFTLSDAVPTQLGVGESKDLSFTMSDADSHSANILLNAVARKVGEVDKEQDEDEVLEVLVKENHILLQGKSDGERQLLITVGNNGLFNMTAYLVKVGNGPTGIAQSTHVARLSVEAGRITATHLVGETLTVHDLSGRLLASYAITNAQQQFALPTHTSALLVRAGKLSIKVQP